MISIDEINKLQTENKRLNDIIDSYQPRLQKYKDVLQEIKGIVTALYMNNWLQMNKTARKSIQLLQEQITKAEEVK
jgi:hypothetical protein